MNLASEIYSHLPVPPDGYHYRVDKVSPMIHKVVLVFPEMLRKSNVECVHCFIKGSKVYAASNGKTPKPKAVCNLTDLHRMSPWTVNQIPKGYTWSEKDQCFKAPEGLDALLK